MYYDRYRPNFYRYNPYCGNRYYNYYDCFRPYDDYYRYDSFYYSRPYYSRPYYY